MDLPVAVRLAKSTMHTCLFPYKVGEWDPITSAHWRQVETNVNAWSEQRATELRVEQQEPLSAAHGRLVKVPNIPIYMHSFGRCFYPKLLTWGMKHGIEHELAPRSKHELAHELALTLQQSTSFEKQSKSFYWKAFFHMAQKPPTQNNYSVCCYGKIWGDYFHQAITIPLGFLFILFYFISVL